tara:strand:+ start:498 stop:644 length:147 start_codon:yes stop_codon:yes gene_type:complete
MIKIIKSFLKLINIIDHAFIKFLRKIRINSLAIRVIDGLYRGYLKIKL